MAKQIVVNKQVYYEVCNRLLEACKNDGYFEYLYDRYCDESEYEDIKDYAAAFETRHGKTYSFKVEGITPEPFCMVLIVPEFPQVRFWLICEADEVRLEVKVV